MNDVMGASDTMLPFLERGRRHLEPLGATFEPDAVACSLRLEAVRMPASSATRSPNPKSLSLSVTCLSPVVV